MLHKSRTWFVAAVGSAEELAEKLTQHTWTLCTAFELDGYLFANDATSPDGAQEYAVLYRRGEPYTFIPFWREVLKELIVLPLLRQQQD